MFTQLLLATSLANPQLKTLDFSGFTFNVKQGTAQGPGPNNWSSQNVTLDQNGLTLSIQKQENGWNCAEVFTSQRYHFGTYTFKIISNLSAYDPEVVLGLFQYPTTDVGPDTTHEIDIEFAQWGNPSNNERGSFTTWPTTTDIERTSFTFPVPKGEEFICQYTWTPTQIYYSVTKSDAKTPFATYTFRPNNPKETISQKPMPLHVNLWLFKGQSPTSANPVSVIIKEITFKPLQKAR